jgi:hypothetical protein
MPFRVQVGPPQIAIHQGQTVLVSEPDGQINWPSDKGLYFLDTRIVACVPRRRSNMLPARSRIRDVVMLRPLLIVGQMLARPPSFL